MVSYYSEHLEIPVSSSLHKNKMLRYHKDALNVTQGRLFLKGHPTTGMLLLIPHKY